jgi:alanyl-tRNA synthetase
MLGRRQYRRSSRTIKAGDLIKDAALEIAGSGGGKPDLAQAGGTNINGIDLAFGKIRACLFNL